MLRSLVGSEMCIRDRALPVKAIELVRGWIPALRHNFHDLKMSLSVEYARHALAIDDQRLSFHPKLFEERGGRRRTPALPGGDLFSNYDITDLHKTAKKLNAKNNPISIVVRKKFSEPAIKLLNTFKQMEGRLTSPNQEDELCNVIVDNLNQILDTREALCDLPSSPDPAHNSEIAALTLSLIHI